MEFFNDSLASLMGKSRVHPYTELQKLIMPWTAQSVVR